MVTGKLTTDTVYRVVPETWELKNGFEFASDAYSYIAHLQEQGQADWNTGALDALQAAIKDQGTPSGIKWIDGLSKLMRPLITLQWVVILYPAVIISTFVILYQQGVPVIDAMNRVFGPEEKGLVAFIADFWFIGRVLEAGRKLRGRP